MDHVLVLHEKQIHRVRRPYVEYFNRARPHQGIRQQVPEREVTSVPSAQPDDGKMTIVSAIATTLFLGGWSGPGVAFLTTPGMAFGWQFLGNILAPGNVITKVYLPCFVFIWVHSTLLRLRSDQLMQFALLMLIPVTLGTIQLTALIYRIHSSFGLSNLVFLIVLGVVNFVLLGGFIRVINRATLATTRHAQAPALRARRRAADAAQLLVRAGVASTSQK